jgi:hypothetical protein
MLVGALFKHSSSFLYAKYFEKFPRQLSANDLNLKLTTALFKK